jgi:uncharacterized protein (DUF1778 family)
MGRKKVQTKAKSGAKIDVRLRIDEALQQRIQAAAEQEGNSVASFIRSAIVKELKRREGGD